MFKCNYNLVLIQLKLSICYFNLYKKLIEIKSHFIESDIY